MNPRAAEGDVGRGPIAGLQLRGLRLCGRATTDAEECCLNLEQPAQPHRAHGCIARAGPLTCLRAGVYRP